MSNVVLKYGPLVKGDNEIQMPQGAKILSFARKNGSNFVYALGNDSARLVTRRVYLAGTGPQYGVLPAGKFDFLGTNVSHSTGSVWHAFVESTAKKTAKSGAKPVKAAKSGRK